MRLHRGVVVAVRAPAHRHRDAPIFQRITIVVRAVLAATIGVAQQPRGRVAQAERKPERLCREAGVNAITHRPADQAAAE